MNNQSSLLSYVKEQIDMVDNDFDSQIRTLIIAGLMDIERATKWNCLTDGSIFLSDNNLTINNYNNLSFYQTAKLLTIANYCVLKVSKWEDRYNKVMQPFYNEEMSEQLTTFRYEAMNHTFQEWFTGVDNNATEN